MNVKLHHLERLSRWELFQLVFDALTFIDTHSQEMPQSFTNKAEELRTIFDIYDVEMALERKIPTSEVFEAEQLRDYDVRKIYNLIYDYSDYRYDKQIEKAAQALIAVFKPYGTGSSISRMPQEEQTAVLINLLQDLDREATQQHIATLRLTTAVEALSHSNNYFIQSQHIRHKQEARYVTGVVKAVRKDLTKHFLEFADVVNALATIEGQEKYAELKKIINELIKKYVTTAWKRKRKKVVED
ncbi:MAG: DUF6261 family protein [Dysgonamonadaceae bacterium]|nr:DUF6261 family protein [Dysgonamonadaceae bacterium]MDD4728471.1 DUF6261 family protein [Dysgonamonadaceae bacterium]